VRPVGLPGNRGAAGAKVRVFEAGTGKLLWYEEVIIRAKQVQQSYYALAETERHFGLGARTSVDVTVHFDPSNKLVRQNGVKANSTVRISEDGNGTIVTPSATPPVQNAVDASVAAMDGGAKLDASTSTDGGARGDGAAEGSAGARVGAEMREADGPTGVAPEAAPGPAGCGCRFGGRSRSGGGGALLLVLTCLARRRRARGVRTADVDAAVAAIVL